MSDTLAAVQSTMAAAQQTVASLGTQLRQAASTGDFQELLSLIENGLNSLESNGSATTTANSFAINGLGTDATGASNVSGADVVADAKQYLGVPYVWGGTNPATGLDCSGFTQLVYGNLGISIPRTSQEQVNVGTPVSSLANAQPGDLVFFEPSASGPGHVGIYIGNNQMIDSPHTGTDVQIQTITTPPCAIRQILSNPSGSFSNWTATTSSTGTALANVPASLASLFVSAAGKYGLPPQLLAAVAQTESNFNTGAVSSAGAEGLMQIMPSTAAGLGINPFDPTQAVNAAAQILSGNLQAFGSVPLALAAYNAGAGAVEEYGGIPPYPQTQAYVQKVMSLAGMSSS